PPPKRNGRLRRKQARLNRGPKRPPRGRCSHHRRDARCLRARPDRRRRPRSPRSHLRSGGLMQPEPALVLFCGGMGGSPVEDALGGALRECALDTLTEALATGAFTTSILVADPLSAGYLEGRLPK